MKIAVNLLPFREKIAGAGKYAQKIIQELVKLDSENQYYLFVTKKGEKNFHCINSNFHFVEVNIDSDSFLARIFWEQFVFPFHLRKLKPNLIFTPSVAVPVLYKARYFTTIHDLAYKNKKKYPLIRRIYVKLITKVAVQKSIVIFTVSNYSKNEIQKEFNIPGDKIFVTYNGVDEIFFTEYTSAEKIRFREGYCLPEHYFLYVGAVEPGKNLDKMIMAFSKFIQKKSGAYYLAITTGIGWKQDFLINMINQLGIKDKIIFLPFIPEQDLPLLYKCSEMFLYLSSYEGFGIPVLEALAAGIPVITSKSEAILEFAGKGVYSVNQNIIDEIVNGMIKIIENKDFVYSNISKGKSIALSLRWVNSATIIHKLIKAQCIY